jgi:hypothetical protein
MRALVVVLALAPFVASANCGTGGGQCPCPACAGAVSLTVTDEAGNGLTDWLMEATLNGVPVDDFGACAPQNRVGSNCVFGQESGMYHVVVRAAGFETREIAVRVAAPSGADCCNGFFCVGPVNIDARMEPLQ